MIDVDEIAPIEDAMSQQGLNLNNFIIESLPVGILTVDSDLVITSFNPWAEKITGYSAREVLGRFCGEILQGGKCGDQCPLRTTLTRKNHILKLETSIQSREGDVIPVRMNTAALINDEGKLLGGVEAFQDIIDLKSLEREKDGFISMIAHDMRSSVTIIGGFVLRLLKKTGFTNGETQEKYLNIIRSETGKLETVINDFLEFSRMQAGVLKPDIGPTSLDKDLMELLETYQLKANQFGIKIEIQSSEALPIIDADSKMLRRVFTNLLDNALKFSKKGSKIIILTETKEQEVSISVIDNGIGIAPDDLPHLFDPFHRGKVGDQIAGFGLGLASVKAIVKAHGGKVRVESELDKGSIFTVSLPKVI